MSSQNENKLDYSYRGSYCGAVSFIFFGIYPRKLFPSFGTLFPPPPAATSLCHRPRDAAVHGAGAGHRAGPQRDQQALRRLERGGRGCPWWRGGHPPPKVLLRSKSVNKIFYSRRKREKNYSMLAQILNPDFGPPRPLPQRSPPSPRWVSVCRISPPPTLFPHTGLDNKHAPPLRMMPSVTQRGKGPMPLWGAAGSTKPLSVLSGRAPDGIMLLELVTGERPQGPGARP